MKTGILIMAALLATAPAAAGVLMSQEQALANAFGGAKLERRTFFADDSAVRTIEKSARSKMEGRVVTYYVATSTAGTAGTAYFSTHVVRTMPETAMFVINPDGTLRSVELLAFYEPEDYKPPRRWLGLFSGKKLNDDLWIKRGVRNVTGATLTAQAIIDAARRALAVHEYIQGQEKGTR